MNASTSVRDLIDAVRAHRPSLVGLSVSIVDHLPEAMRVAVRAAAPRALVLLGGQAAVRERRRLTDEAPQAARRSWLRVIVDLTELKQVRLTGTSGPNGVVLRVIDQGTGIPDGPPASLFEAYVRGPDRGPEARSVGLGLAIARWIVDAHDGEIAVETTSSQGTTIRIWLPRP